MGIEAALFGAPLLSSTAGASTVWMLGAGGVSYISLVSVVSGVGALSAVSSILGGAQSYAAGGDQAALALSQASLRGVEAERVAQREAKFAQEEALDTERRQKLAYMASGVTLEGSPLLVMEETRQRGIDNVDEILKSGQAASQAAAMEGRIQASTYKASGRQKFVSGITSAAGSFGGLQ